MESVPIILNQYRIGKTLGIGAFGKVKLGVHIVTNQKVAIKILNKGKIKHMEMSEKVRREINILKMCKHPHIIRLYEVIDTPSDIFVVMEYVSGGELFDYIVSRGRLPPDEARNFFHMIISGVEYCHYHRVVHRDLKPENLLLDSDNNIKIADFGLSNVIHDGDFLRTSCGSPNYAAPEVISGNLYAGTEVDVWSCGVILYALLCGMLPFDDESIPNLFKKIKSGMYSLPSHLSQLSRDLILRMLVVDPMKRITIADIRMHPWFQHKLPAYLALPPAMIERTERYVDDEIVTAVCELPLRGVSRDTVVNAVVDHNSSNPIAHDLRVTYELLLDAKRHKLRIADVVIALKDQSNTPPTATSIALSPRTLSSPANSMSSHISTSSSGRKVDLGSIPRGMYGTSSGASSISGSNPPAGPTSSSAVQPSSDSMSKKRRWYLGIQSKKEPAHVMTEVHKALLALDCCWYPVTNYRVLALWNHWHSDHQTESERDKAFLDLENTSHITPMDIASPIAIPPTPLQQQFRRANDNDSELDLGTSPKLGKDEGNSNHPSRKADLSVKVALSLYKVQQNIYLLDFQRVEGDAFGFMKLCALIITELKNLSAASRGQMSVSTQMEVSSGG